MLIDKFNIKTIKLVKNFTVLFSGSILGQLIVFATIPYFTRVYDAEIFGVLALYSSIIAILSLISNLRYELAIMLPKEDSDAVNVLALNIIVASLFSSILFIIIFLFKESLLSFLNITSIGNYIYLVPLSVIIAGNVNAIDSWNNRCRNYKYISTGLISRSTSMVLSQFFMSLSKWSYLGLVPGLIVGQVINFIISLKLAYKTIVLEIEKVSLKRIFELASKYKDMPRFNTFISLTNTLSNELPILMLSSLFGLNIVGIFGLAVKVSKVLPGIIGASISKIFYKESTIVFNKGEEIYAFLKKTVKSLFLVSILIFSFIFIISYYLDFFLGDKWVDVGVYVRILLPWLFFGFIHSSISSVSVTLNKQKVLIVFDFVFLILRFSSILIGYKFYNSVIISLELFSFVGVIFNISMIGYYLYIAKYNK